MRIYPPVSSHPLGFHTSYRSARTKRSLQRIASAIVCSSLMGCITTPTQPHATGNAPPKPEKVVNNYQGPKQLKLDDSQAGASTQATDRLRRTLQQLAGEGRFLLGHEDTTAYGVGWSEEPDRSDPKSVCGSHVGVYGWDLFRIELESKANGDGVKFDLMRRRIQEAYARGGINTVSWHVDNPVSGGDAWDTEPAVGAVIPGGSHHELYTVYLDRAADFLQSCRGPEGELVPIIFRPFHEHTGSWFWWGASHATDEEYIKLWRFTVDHLRATRGLRNLLFAFSPGGGEVKSDADYLFRYPGDEYVDVMGIDHYYHEDTNALVRGVRIAVMQAEQRGKVAALTEFGVRDGLSEATPKDWFSTRFFTPLIEDPLASRIAYALAWRNANPEHFFLPHPGHPTEADFRRVCNDPRLLLQEDLPLPQTSTLPSAEAR